MLFPAPLPPVPLTVTFPPPDLICEFTNTHTPRPSELPLAFPVTLTDQWHLGSDTKAMTATLVARLVEQIAPMGTHDDEDDK